MTAITISDEDPRSIKAVEIAARAGQWLKCRTTAGVETFGVPSQCEAKAGRYYLVTADGCDCEDFKRHGLSTVRIGRAGLHGPCKHVMAVRLHIALRKGAQKPPRRRSAFAPSHIDSAGNTVYLPRRADTADVADDAFGRRFED